MAIINKTGITNGGTIESEHITRIIDALSLGSSEIAATGSFTGSLLGTASFATTASAIRSVRTNTNAEFFPMIVDSSNTSPISELTYTPGAVTINPASAAITANSFIGNLTGTASFALNSPDTTFPYTGSARITGSLIVTGSLTTSGSLNMTAGASSVVNLGTITAAGNFVIPVTQPTTPLTGSMYYDTVGNILYIYDGTQWRNIN